MFKKGIVFAVVGLVSTSVFSNELPETENCYQTNTWTLGSLAPDTDLNTFNVTAALGQYSVCLQNASSESEILDCNSDYYKAISTSSGSRIEFGNNSGNNIVIREQEQIVCGSI